MPSSVQLFGQKSGFEKYPLFTVDYLLADLLGEVFSNLLGIMMLTPRTSKMSSLQQFPALTGSLTLSLARIAEYLKHKHLLSLFRLRICYRKLKAYRLMNMQGSLTKEFVFSLTSHRFNLDTA